VSARWKRLGAKPADIPYCAFYAKKLEEAGWAPTFVDAAISFGLKHQEVGWDKFEGLAIHQMRKQGLNDSVIDSMLIPADVIRESPHVREALEAQSFAEDHAAGRQQAVSTDRLDEIRRMMADDPDSYWGNPKLQAEFASLIEAQEGAPPGEVFIASEQVWRKKEIERLMAETPDKYWGNPSLQAEFAELAVSEQPSGPQEDAR
jgi:hypothetical protein